MSISIIDIDKYSSEIIGDIKKLATQKKASDKRNSDEFSSEEFVKIFSTISKKTNAKRKTKTLNFIKNIGENNRVTRKENYYVSKRKI